MYITRSYQAIALSVAAFCVFIAFTSPKLALEVASAYLLSIAFMPVFHRISAATRIPLGILVVVTAITLVGVCGAAIYFTGPAIAKTLAEVGRKMPAILQDSLVMLKAEVERMFPTVDAEKLIESILKTTKEMGQSKDTARIGLLVAYTGLQQIGVFVTTFIFMVILASEWTQTILKTNTFVARVAGSAADDVMYFTYRFQHYNTGLFTGVAKLAIIFIPLYIILFTAADIYLSGWKVWLRGEGSLGWLVVPYGLLSGGWGALPIIGGFLTQSISVAVSTWHFGLLSTQGAMALLLIWGPAAFVHFLEAKFISGKVLGEQIGWTAFPIVIVMIAMALTFGLIKGLIFGFSLIAAWCAWYDTAIRTERPLT